MNNNERIALVIRSVGAAIVLLSILVTWLTISFIFTIELSLLDMVRLVLEGDQETLGPLRLPVVVALGFVVGGGILAFLHAIGGVLPLLGAGFLIFQVETALAGSPVFSYGIGLFAAIVGGIVVLVAAAIPKEKKKR